MCLRCGDGFSGALDVDRRRMRSCEHRMLQHGIYCTCACVGDVASWDVAAAEMANAKKMFESSRGARATRRGLGRGPRD